MYVILFCIRDILLMCIYLSVSILFKYERRLGLLFVVSWARVRRVALSNVGRCDLHWVV